MTENNTQNHAQNDSLHGKTLESIVVFLQEYYGWKELGQKVDIKCFTMNPSVKSSLTFLRNTDWARKKVESLYLYTLRQIKREQKSTHR